MNMIGAQDAGYSRLRSEPRPSCDRRQGLIRFVEGPSRIVN